MGIERRGTERGIRPWHPSRELDALEQRFEDIFGRPFPPATWWRTPREGRNWAPPIEVFEKEDKFVVKAELPGMNEEDIDVSVVGETLTIKGEKRTESEVKEEDYHCCECSYGSFFRAITLPSTVDADKVEARYEAGVLEVSIPKAPEVMPKKISISTQEK